MENDREKPGPKPFEWDPSLGEVKPQGHWWAEKVHSNVTAKKKAHKYKALIQKMALDPDFEIQVLGLVETDK